MKRREAEEYPKDEPTEKDEVDVQPTNDTMPQRTEKDEVDVQPTNDTMPQRIGSCLTQTYRSDGSAIYQEDPPGL